VLLILLLALVLRLVRRSPVWGGSDAADMPEMVDSVLCRPGRFLDGLTEMALYRLGGVQSSLLYLQMSVMRLLHLRVTEFDWELLTLLVGLGNVYLAYRVAKELAGVESGLMAALLLAVCPITLIQCRHLGAPWMFEEAFQLLLVLLLLRLQKEPTRGTTVAFYVTIACYFWAGNQMMGIFPVLAFGVVSGLLERTDGSSWSEFLRKRYASFAIIVPLASLAVLLRCTFVLRRGHLAHALFDKRHVLGFYMARWFEDMSTDVGPAVTWFGLGALLLAAVSEKRLFTVQRLPTVLFLCYAGPFWCLVPPGSTLTRGYITYGISALLVVLATATYRAALAPAARRVLPAVASLILLVEDGQSAYHLYALSLLSVRGFQGSYTRDNGVKAAAVWIRERPRTGRRIFSDASGGTGLEPSLMRMYFRRPFLAMFDASPATRPYEVFRKQAKEMEHLVVSPGAEPMVTRYFGTAFHQVLRVLDDGEPRLLVYERGESTEPPANVEAAAGNREFDRKYSLLCGR
jgi:hypothetical protein